MSRAYTPSGRFDTDFETNEIHDAITKDLTNPVGTTVQWFVWNSLAFNVDPIYDVGSNYLTSTTGASINTTMSGTVGTTAITVVSTAGVTVDMAVNGSGIAKGTLVKSISGTTITLTLPNVNNIAAATAVNFTSDGRQWKTPVDVPAIRAVVKQSQTNLIEEGFYNADRLHLTIDKEILSSLIPGVLDDPDPLNRDRIVWKGQVYRPLMNQLLGIISERFAIISFECQQIMPEELVNDPQFQAYAN
jgi:hypothetical protein